MIHGSRLCGFVPHQQPMDIAEGIRWSLGKATEWGRPLLMACLDVSKAFDAIHNWVVEAALLDNDAPAWLVAAVLREMVGQK